MEKKILLIDPPFQKFMGFSKGGIPLGLLSLAGTLKAEGYEVEVLDADYNPNGTPYPFMAKIGHYDEYLNNLDGPHPIWDGIAFQIEKSKPDVVGVSFISTKLRSGLRVAQIAKDLGVKRTIAGGPHVTIRPYDVIKTGSPIDYAVVGEGEQQLEMFVGRPDRLIERPGRIKNLNSLPWPARETLIGIRSYSAKDLGFIMTSRGCPGSCNFCCSEELWGKKVRFRNIDDVVEEMDDIHERYGTTKFYITDDTFTISKRRVSDFTKRIRNRDYEWGCLTRADKMDENMLEQMSSSGCSMVKIGVESGSQKVLDLMNKGTTLDHVRNAAKLLNDAFVPWMAYVMVGVPGETSEDADKTMRFIEEIKPTYISSSIYTPYPGTGFSSKSGNLHYELAEANHHSLKVLAGDVPREKIIEFMKFSDKYNDIHTAKLL